MIKAPITVILGDEYDDRLRSALRAVLGEKEAVPHGKSWGVGGSQEIESMEIIIGGDLVTIESETYVGLTVTGPKETVEDIARQVREKVENARRK